MLDYEVRKLATLGHVVGNIKAENMKLSKIRIENYKSIESLEFDIVEINGSYTYSLLGINESGKSSFLKAISLFESDDLKYPRDYFDEYSQVIIKFSYLLQENDIKDLFKLLTKDHQFEKALLDKIKIELVEIVVSFEANESQTKTYIENLKFTQNIFPEYTIKSGAVLKKTELEKELEDLNLNDFFVNYLPKHFWSYSHNVIFWRPTPEYLLLDEIDLLSFSTNPENVSVPLLNCFILSGIEQTQVANEVAKLISPVAINSLQSKLSELTTKHINNVWPEHPITITFQINDNKITLLIEDNGVKFKPKTADQRSDGFKQFISFLLTVSIENHNKVLSETILLIDEPETHLHPPAQINLLNELIKITSNSDGNILFFATHSNYLIDKNNLDRNFKVDKLDNSKTFIKRIEKKTSTYAEVNYEVFGINSSDYHNELYGFIESEDKSKLNSIDKDKKWIDSRNNREKDVSLSEYIRHSIHHPENTLNIRFSEIELAESIEKLKSIKEKI